MSSKTKESSEKTRDEAASSDADYIAEHADGGMFGDGPPARKAKAFLPTAKRLLGLFRAHTVAMVLITIAVCLYVALTVAAPKILGHAMDVIMGGILGASMPAGVTKEQAIEAARQSGNNNFADMLAAAHVVPGEGIDFSALSQLILTVLALYFVASVLMWGEGYVLNRLVMRIVLQLRNDIQAKLHRLPLSYFDGSKRGDILSRVTNDVDNVQQALQQALAQLLSSALSVLGYAVMMFVVSWQLALIAIIAIPLSAAIVALIGSRSQKLFARQWKATGDLNGQIEESFSGHTLVTLFGRQDEMLRHFEERNDELYRAAFGAQFVSGAMMPAMQWVNYLSYVGIAVLGGLRVASGQMTLGDATAFIQYSREFNQPLAEMGGMANMLQSGVASAERVFEFLDAEEQDADDPREDILGQVRGEVAFEHVRFGYDSETVLIDDLSLRIRPGSTVAIVGPTGAGKTTLVNLMMRFYELNAGKITLDGVNIAEIPREMLRSKIGMVLQDAWIFKGTIADNIRYGNLEASEEEVLAAAKATYVDRFVRALPDGYETMLEGEGTSLSAGEMQLVTIARTFVANPSLLILDEATSSVDTRTEVLVQSAMAALRAQRTSFVIAHRLSTIRDADVILMMANGKILEQGNHEDLIAKRGAYYHLYQEQFSGKDAEEQFELDER